LIDELSLGLAPVAVERLVAAIRQIGQAGQTVLLVEQDIHTAFDIASRGYVLETGHIAGQGAGSDLLADPQVKAAYIGL
ncbi:MAG TPA: branched-chain amino acid ABC transporter ATP-binding protein, partial [Anaerolineae bacterium]